MSTVTDVKHWLRNSPQPTVVKCVCQDGQTRMVRIDVKSKKKYVLAEAAIRDCGSVSIEALDAKGHTLRFAELEVEADASSSVVPVAKTEDQSTLAHFASLLANAYKDGAKSAESPTKMAFDTLGQLLGMVLERMERAEQAIIKQASLTQRTAEDMKAEAEEALAMAKQAAIEGDVEGLGPLRGMIENMIQQRLFGAVGPAASPEAKPNGAAHA